ncbi:MAG: tetraacyldisaccharide 4'-kinase [Acidobacteria bacterium]|nr:tetraacyldisaccharide 4'-kinase [Acidobacteriota bacterium]
MLGIASKLYGRVANLRNYLYDRGVFEAHDLGAFTVSIGNITAGGTGKTPLVAYVSELLAARGEKVCILTRGYGRRDPSRRIVVTADSASSNAGDEPVELAQRLKDKAVIIADSDRFAAGEWAKRKFGVTAFVLDDGFQHRRIRRDIDIVCIDAANPFGGGEMLPSGRLREPLANLLRATAIVITRADLVEDLGGLRDEITQFAPAAQIFECRNVLRKIYGLKTDEPLTAGQTRAYAFCGLGNPDSFFALLAKQSIGIAGVKSFPDHHNYTQADITALHREAMEAGAELLLTTAKDAVKLRDLSFTLPCGVVGIDLELDDAERFAAIF